MKGESFILDWWFPTFKALPAPGRDGVALLLNAKADEAGSYSARWKDEGGRTNPLSLPSHSACLRGSAPFEIPQKARQYRRCHSPWKGFPSSRVHGKL